MTPTTRKCPMCAENIPAEATVCPFCDTQLASEPAPAAAPPPAPPRMVRPAAKPARTGKAIGLGFAGLALVGIIAAAIWFLSQNGTAGLPPATAMSTERPPATPNLEATAKAYNATATAEAENAWVQKFAEPILEQIENRPPDFSDDFSDWNYSNDHWNVEPGVTIGNGIARFRADGDYAYVGVDGPLSSNDFVLEFEISPQSLTTELWTGVAFRVEGDEYNHFTLSMVQSPELWFSFGKNDAQGQPGILGDGLVQLAGLGNTITEMVIVQGNQAALYLDGQPIYYTRSLWLHGEYVNMGITSVSGESVVLFDNVKFWDLNK